MLKDKTQIKNSIWKSKKTKKTLEIFLSLIFIITLIFSATFYAYNRKLDSVTPENIKNPKYAHHHFRLQIIINGEALDFSKKEFQEEYKPGQCSTEITDPPIHFHDNMDQIVHIHWSKITGGQVLKYYGLNKIGGPDDVLGYKNSSKEFKKPIPVKIFGNLIPDFPEDAKIWVYSGTESEYKERKFGDSLNQDLETFFGQKSSYTLLEEVSYIKKNTFASEKYFSKLFALPKVAVLAHTNSENKNLIKKTQAETKNQKKSQDQLEKLNDLIGNVVIFVQNDKPSQDDVKDKFANLLKLEDSQCGG